MVDFSPPGCEHAHCSFHAGHMLSAEGRLRLIGAGKEESCCSANFGPNVAGQKTVETVSCRWTLPSPTSLSGHLPILENIPCCGNNSPDATGVEEPLDLDVFLQEIATRSFTISAMAFQDADNLDLERLRGCCISVISHDGRLIPFVHIILLAEMDIVFTGQAWMHRSVWDRYHPLEKWIREKTRIGVRTSRQILPGSTPTLSTPEAK